MDVEDFMRTVLHGTRILRPPRHVLATFGTTMLNYVLLSELPGAKKRCRRREGRVTAQRPQIITPDLFRKRFEGFGEEAEMFSELMERLYGKEFRGLAYTFKNELDRTSLESASLREVAQRVLDVMNREDAPRTALLEGPDAAWSLSIMKFIVEVSLRSFSANVRELDERGFFHPEQRAEARDRHRIEVLFREATRSPGALKELGEVLKNTGLFADYEDRFFALVRSLNAS
jgi:hypothetical protein